MQGLSSITRQVQAARAPRAVASVIAAFCYLRIIKVMYVDPPGQPLDEGMRIEHRVVLFAAALVMSLGWLPFLDGFGLLGAAASASESPLG